MHRLEPGGAPGDLAGAAAGAGHQHLHPLADAGKVEGILLRAQQDAFNLACVGQRMEVLVTGTGRRPGQIAGRSPWLQPVHGEGPPGLEGQIVPAVVIASMTNSLSVRLEGQDAYGSPAAPRQEKAAA